MKRPLDLFSRIMYSLTLLWWVLLMGLALGSWVVQAADSTWLHRSLLSTAGVRWFFSHVEDALATPTLLAFVLSSFTLSAVVRSGFWLAVFRWLRHRKASSQEQFALFMAVLVLVAQVLGMVLLTALPHAILLSVTGALFPSSFSMGLLPTSLFMLTVVALVYGVLSGTLRTPFEIVRAICTPDDWLKPLLLCYVSGALFWACLTYVLGENTIFGT